ncbi:septum site-determining protein Ssd [Nocardioides sp. Kera G14]|uniref:septum site-determining protein Ssd n=1 Tax=Nocardioides sp. Kera G14 TaxID=2884264 RepID=UPI001D106A22|nr:septum site-determining protein Ssd [Nocardioides sp. Kera G14]UDY23803.1 septum site determining protein [Nocardioides sp. Kera G14]
MTGQALLVTRDSSLREELTRLAAAAGAPVVSAPDSGAALRAWGAAGLVLVGGDLASEVAAAAPPRRSRVGLVTWGAQPDGLFRAAVDLGAESVIELPEGAGWLTELMGDLGEDRPARGLVLGVVGGSGGVGATTVACALGQMAGRPSAVVDLDPLGPGLDRVLGMEELGGIRWADLGTSSGRLNARALREAMPHRDGLAVLTFRGTEGGVDRVAVRECLAAVRRGHDTVVIDLPRTGGEMWDEVVPRCGVVLVVVEPTVTGVASASRVVAALPDRGRARLVVRSGGISPDAVARALDVSCVAVLPTYKRVGESIDLGFGPVRSRSERIARAMRGILSEVAA